MAEHGPSEKAIEAAVRECTRLLNDDVDGNDAAKDALAAAHDPALGLDRSVCLRDVLKRLPEFMTFTPAQGERLIRAVTESSSPDREGAE